MSDVQDFLENQGIAAYAPTPTQSGMAGALTGAITSYGPGASAPTPTPTGPDKNQAAYNKVYDMLIGPTGGVSRGGDFADNFPEVGDAERAARQKQVMAQMSSWQNSKFKNAFKAPQNLSDIIDNMDKPAAPPDMSRLVNVPGGSPDQLMDSETGDIYRWNSKHDIRYAGNITSPFSTELQRGTAAAVAGLKRRGILPAATPHPLEKGHSWRSKTSGQVPGAKELAAIDSNNPTLEDIATNLSNVSGTAWAQVDDNRKRAIGIGSVLALALGGAAGGYAGLAGEGALSAAQAGATAAGTYGAGTLAGMTGGGMGLGALGSAGVAGGAAAGTMAAGQAASMGFGHGGSFDWPAIVKAGLLGSLGSLVGSGVSAGTGALGANQAVSGIASQGASKLTTMGVGNYILPTHTNITAYTPYPGTLTPQKAQQVMTKYPY